MRQAGQTVVATGAPLRFRDELRDFLAFVRRPRLGPRLPGRWAGDAVTADWRSGLVPGRLFKWALFLWAMNLVFLGPIAVAAATAAGAQHRLNIHAIPWLQALLWAPVVEELVFRYGLRRVYQAWWLLPAAVACMLMGPTTTAVLLLVAILLVLWRPLWRGAGSQVADPGRGDATALGLHGTQRLQPALSWHARRVYCALFPWVFHGTSLVFAAVHLYNFTLHQASLWLLPLLVLPQWLTGLALGWHRIRKGIAAAMALHALFNGGPLLLVWLIVSTL